MTDQHPITPPPELVRKWQIKLEYCTKRADREAAIAKIFQLGADQELEACCEWVSQFNYDDYSYGDRLRAARRRPKPPSLKERAVFAAAVLQSPDETCSIAEIAQHWHTIRHALESLPD